MESVKRFFLFLVVISFFTFSGCASLPRVSEVIEEAPGTQEQPRILSARGFLSPEKSRALIERLKRSVEPTDLLDHHIAVIESVSGSPTAGSQEYLFQLEIANSGRNTQK
jgi:cardiolipin synthase